jgi:hypothetical protein
VVLRSTSRFGEKPDQVVESFVLDVDTGVMYSLPRNTSANLNAICRPVMAIRKSVRATFREVGYVI